MTSLNSHSITMLRKYLPQFIHAKLVLGIVSRERKELYINPVLFTTNVNAATKSLIG